MNNSLPELMGLADDMLSSKVWLLNRGRVLWPRGSVTVGVPLGCTSVFYRLCLQLQICLVSIWRGVYNYEEAHVYDLSQISLRDIYDLKLRLKPRRAHGYDTSQVSWRDIYNLKLRLKLQRGKRAMTCHRIPDAALTIQSGFYIRNCTWQGKSRQYKAGASQKTANHTQSATLSCFLFLSFLWIFLFCPASSSNQQMYCVCFALLSLFTLNSKMILFLSSR